jgi:molybdenum cofactor cytidylyltransferase
LAFVDTAVVLLAAGRGTRLGGNKLQADLGGTMLGLHAARTFAALDFGWRFAVVDVNNVGLNAGLEALGYRLLINTAPDRGLSHSLALGAEAAEASTAVAMLVGLADMPFVSALHIRTLCATFGQHGRKEIVASAHSGQPMPPVLFNQQVFADLRQHSGDQGARTLLAKAITVDAERQILADVDTPEMLHRARAHLR